LCTTRSSESVGSFGALRVFEHLESVRIFGLDGGDARGRFHLARHVVHPDVERRAPVALAREGPVDVVVEEVAEASVFDVGREPGDGLVVLLRLLDEARRADVPGGARELDERIGVGAPAERVVVPVGLRVDEPPAPLELGEDVLVAVFDPTAGVGRELRAERAVGADGAEEREVLVLCKELPVRHVVVLAERGRDVDDARAGVERDEVGREDLPHGRVPLRVVRVEVERRHVRGPHELFPEELRERRGGIDLELLRQRLDERLGHHELLARELDDHVRALRAHGRVHVRRERPRGRRPHEELGALELGALAGGDRERHVNARIVYGFVPLPHLSGGERRAALGPPPHDLVALVEEPLFEEVRERPPHALHVALVEGDVGLVEVDPEADALGELLPLLRVAEHGGDALLDEGLHAVGLDGGLAVHVELFFDLDLDGEAVRVPAGLARHVVAAHRLVPGEEILHDAREHVAVVGQAVRRGRALVEDPRLAVARALERFLEDADLPPERENLTLFPGEVELGGDLGEERLCHRSRVIALFRPVPGPKVRARLRAGRARSRASSRAPCAP
jgi:hypothetical protein